MLIDPMVNAAPCESMAPLDESFMNRERLIRKSQQGKKWLNLHFSLVAEAHVLGQLRA
jgi:hypothetical protein